jgi:hypothetical protein
MLPLLLLEGGDQRNGKEGDTIPQIDGGGLMRRNMRRPLSIW